MLRREDASPHTADVQPRATSIAIAARRPGRRGSQFTARGPGPPSRSWDCALPRGARTRRPGFPLCIQSPRSSHSTRYQKPAADVRDELRIAVARIREFARAQDPRGAPARHAQRVRRPEIGAGLALEVVGHVRRALAVVAEQAPAPDHLGDQRQFLLADDGGAPVRGRERAGRDSSGVGLTSGGRGRRGARTACAPVASCIRGMSGRSGRGSRASRRAGAASRSRS